MPFIRRGVMPFESKFTNNWRKRFFVYEKTDSVCLRTHVSRLRTLLNSRVLGIVFALHQVIRATLKKVHARKENICARGLTLLRR